MKNVQRLIIGIVLMLHATAVSATGQQGDVIYIDGERWTLLARPLFQLEERLYEKVEKLLPQGRAKSTSNWHGFVAHWLLKDSCLYLDKIEVASRYIKSDSLKTVLGSYSTPDGIFAGWCNSWLRVGRGKVTRYVHSGFDRDMEEEYTLVIEGGKMIYKDTSPPRLAKEGLQLFAEDLLFSVSETFRFEDFKEMDNEKRMQVFMEGMKVDADGRMLDVVVSVKIGETFIDDRTHPLVMKLENIMKSIYPWEVYEVSGKYRTRYASYSFYMFKEWRKYKKHRDEMKAKGWD